MAGIKANNIRLRDDSNTWVPLADWNVQDIINSDNSTSIGDMLNSIVANEEAIAAKTDTKNTAGATTTSSQTLYLIGATTAATNPRTYINNISATSVTGSVILGNNNNKIAIVNNIKLDSSGNGISINNDNGTGTIGTQLTIPAGTWTLGTAAKANTTAAVTTGSTNLPTSKAVSSAIQTAVNNIVIPTAATTVPQAVVSGTAITGSSNKYAKEDHAHNISIATGDNNGQIKIAGQNVSVKGLGTAAYRPVAASLTDTTTGALIPAATVSAAISNTVSSISNTINNLKKVYVGTTTPTGTEEIWLYRNFDITQQPQNAIINAMGETVNFMVDTGDPNAAYQWQSSSNNGSSWSNSNINTATNKTNIYSFNSTATSIDYLFRCKVTFENGTTINSDSARIIVYHIITQPQNATISQIGNSVTFTVKTGDPNATYQWQRRNLDTESWQNSAGTSTASTYTFNSTTTNQSWSWRCHITFSDGTTEDSNIVKYTVAS